VGPFEEIALLDETAECAKESCFLLLFDDHRPGPHRGT
jgi:hypothetical protein